jgi:transketolase
MSDSVIPDVEQLYQKASGNFAHWEKIKDLIDQLIDLPLNLRQSAHPGGSRSKVHMMVTLLLSGAMRWDIRHPEKRFADRFILAAGHTNPLVYSTLSVLNAAMRIKYRQTGDKKYLVPEERGVFPEDLINLRRWKGLPGHAEMAGKTLFFKFNTGPSGHGMPAAAGEALALKMGGVEQVKVFAVEGEGGLTPGAAHETKNSAWAMGLNNLFFLVDWNDFGIDDQPISSVVYGTPQTWFESSGWRTMGTEQGMEWAPVARVLLEATHGANGKKLPNCAWFKTRKGRGYGVYDNKSHGVPHAPMNSPAFWETKRDFAEKYGITFEGFGQPAPATEAEQRAQTKTNIMRVIEVLQQDQALVDYIADTLVSLGDSVPETLSTCRICAATPFEDKRLWDYENYPADLFVAPGAKVANRAALAKWGAYINAMGKKHYDRPLFVVSSADLAESTNIAGFARGYGDFAGFGRYNRDTNTFGALLPQEITEFTNAGIAVGMALVNYAEDPYNDFNGFYTGCSTYGSFVYLKYGLFRLFSQLAQDSELKVGKVLWVAGHSGPETADDSRTHFGIFSPGVTQLFPKGLIINLHPWEHNEVPVLLGAAFQQKAPLVALHLTRPPVTIPDRKALGMPSHLDAAKGAYIIRPYKAGQPRMGTVIVQGTSTTAGIVDILPKLDAAGLNVKIVAALSRELFDLQPESYRNEVLSAVDTLDSMVITSEALRLMTDWVDNPVSAQYSMSADWDNRWRTGGNIPEVLEEAHLSAPWLLKGIERFASERSKRLAKLQATLNAALKA